MRPFEESEHACLWRAGCQRDERVNLGWSVEVPLEDFRQMIWIRGAGKEGESLRNGISRKREVVWGVEGREGGGCDLEGERTCQYVIGREEEFGPLTFWVLDRPEIGSVR